MKYMNNEARSRHALLATVILAVLMPIALVGVSSGPAAADVEVTFDFICLGYATAVSEDGLCVAGNTQNDYEPFRWNDLTGRDLLGRASVPVLGVSAGIPGISADGARISSTILGADSTYITMGVWTEGEGWHECIPPVPPDGGLIDNSYGSAWGLSGDGEVLVGLYWRPGQPGGLAHACVCSEVEGIVDLGSSGGDSRANAASYDGAVVAGWSAHPETGGWRPAAWVNGSLSVLGPAEVVGEAWAVTRDGAMVGGTQATGDPAIRTAALWRWNGTGWDSTEFLGVLPGTAAPNGFAVVHGLSADGKTAVGYNSFYGDPFYSTGFIWREGIGMTDVEDFLADNGVTVPSWFDIRSLSAITPDGSVILGDGVDTDYIAQSFVIRIRDTSGVPDAAEAPVPSETQVSPGHLTVLSNPARGEATLALNLLCPARVDIRIYGVTGRLIRRLVSCSVPAGSHEVRWDGKDEPGHNVSQGLYFVRADVDGESETSRVILVR